MENCTRYDCVETAVGAVILASGVVCPPFNDTECLQVWTVEIYANKESCFREIVSGRLTNVSVDGFEFLTGLLFNFDLLSCRTVV